MSKIKPEIWQLDDLIKTWENIVTDSEFAASKNIKNPKTKRQNITHFNWSSSVLHYLKQNDVQNLMDDLHQWADETFGKTRDATAPLHHLHAEVSETIEAIEGLAPDNETHAEFADCFLLILNAASKYGMDFQMLLNAAKAKMVINKKRKWGKPDANGVVNHLK